MLYGISRADISVVELEKVQKKTAKVVGEKP